MMNSVFVFELGRLSEALESEWWNKDEFVLFDGPLPPPALNVPFRQDFYCFFCVESGTIENEIDLVSYTLRANDLLFISPIQVVQVKSISADAKGKLVAFKKSFVDGEYFNPTEKLSFMTNAPPVIALTGEEAGMIVDMIGGMKTHLEDPAKPNRRQVALSMISTLLHEIDAIFRLKSGILDKRLTSQETINIQFRNLVSTFYLKERSVKFYAGMLNITPRHLNELTKEVSGKTAGDYIDEMVVMESKVLLKNTNLPLKQIAELLNFSDQFAFSKYFKKLSKLSPTEYRDLNR
jgi:AraC family transcriptional activator of pobA